MMIQGLAFAAALACAEAKAYMNVLGGSLESCSQTNMALTGFMRDGHCTEIEDDAGSHHICIDLSSTSGGNFCTVTGQSNWCSSSMTCDGDASSVCPVEHWCVCQWAFGSYLANAGGCDQIQDIVCEATNMVALEAYEASASSSTQIADALDCLRSRCGLTTDDGSLAVVAEEAGATASTSNAAALRPDGAADARADDRGGIVSAEMLLAGAGAVGVVAAGLAVVRLGRHRRGVVKGSAKESAAPSTAMEQAVVLAQSESEIQLA